MYNCFFKLWLLSNLILLSRARLVYQSDPSTNATLLSDDQLSPNEAVYRGLKYAPEQTDQVRIQCILSLYEVPVWTLNGQLLPITLILDDGRAKYQLVKKRDLNHWSQSETLIINQIVFDDTGEYRCTQFGQSGHMLHVLVHDWSRFQRHTVSTLNYHLSYASEPIELTCDLNLKEPVRDPTHVSHPSASEMWVFDTSNSNEQFFDRDHLWAVSNESSIITDQLIKRITTTSTTSPSIYSTQPINQTTQWWHWGQPMSELSGQDRIWVNQSGIFTCSKQFQTQRFHVFGKIFK